MTADLFDDAPHEPSITLIAPGAALLHGFARDIDAALLKAFDAVIAQAPLRHLATPGGHSMSVAMSNCGPLGWMSGDPLHNSGEAVAVGSGWDARRLFAATSTAIGKKSNAADRPSPADHRPQGVMQRVPNTSGYRYTAHDPLSGQPWPAMPAIWLDLAARAASKAGYGAFLPDACLINDYQPGAKMSLHQDKDERDLAAPIVSVSLGLPAVFQFGTDQRSDRPQRLRLVHGDVVVWGGASRLAYHGIAPLADGTHALLGRRRINLTFRRAG